jgi:hypothetical protein
MQLDTDESLLTDLLSFPNITDNPSYSGSEIYYNSRRGTIYSSQLESILTQLLSNVDKIETANMNSETLPSVTSFGLNPLGNTCLSSDEKNVLYIDHGDAYSSKLSSFWGIANMIKLVVEAKVDDNDSLYSDFKVEDYYESNISFEVESITGFNPLNFDKENLENWTTGGYKSTPK